MPSCLVFLPAATYVSEVQCLQGDWKNAKATVQQHQQLHESERGSRSDVACMQNVEAEAILILFFILYHSLHICVCYLCCCFCSGLCLLGHCALGENDSETAELLFHSALEMAEKRQCVQAPSHPLKGKGGRLQCIRLLLSRAM